MGNLVLYNAALLFFSLSSNSQVVVLRKCSYFVVLKTLVSNNSEIFKVWLALGFIDSKQMRDGLVIRIFM